MLADNQRMGIQKSMLKGHPFLTRLPVLQQKTAGNGPKLGKPQKSDKKRVKTGPERYARVNGSKTGKRYTRPFLSVSHPFSCVCVTTITNNLLAH